MNLYWPVEGKSTLFHLRETMMTRKSFKTLALVLSAGTLLQFGGCFGNGLFGGFLRGVPGAVVTEFLIDNTGVFDLFPG